MDIKQVKIVHISQTGFSRTDTVTWEIRSPDKLTDDEIDAVIRRERNPEGYGHSLVERVNAPEDSSWRVRVTSWASAG